ncbi:MAG: glycosyltransferase family 39 protein, partial [Planctomycetales bacterium]|nr:glycosyltransferase family 39 protein [Planctomycetales bacterium]
MAQVSYSRLALLVLIVLSVFFVELGAARLWDRDEPRNARASHEMLARGDWIVPTFNGSLRDHKPILLYWGQMLSYLTLGESEFTARLPSALCALLTVGATAVLASRLSGKRRGISHEGFWAAGAMATCSLFVMAGRAATPDSCLIAFSTLGIAALVLSTVTPAHPYSSGAVGRGRWLPAMWGYTMLGLAMLAKGPVGLVLPLAVVHLWWMICRHLQSVELVCERPQTLGQRLSAGLLLVWRIGNPLQCWRAIVALRTIPGVLLSLLAAVPWYAAVGLETNGEFLRGFFLEHNVGRAMGAMEGHDGSLLFYPAALLIGTFPWSLWLIPLVMWGRQASRESV